MKPEPVTGMMGAFTSAHSPTPHAAPHIAHLHAHTPAHSAPFTTMSRALPSLEPMWHGHCTHLHTHTHTPTHHIAAHVAHMRCEAARSRAEADLARQHAAQLASIASRVSRHALRVATRTPAPTPFVPFVFSPPSIPASLLPHGAPSMGGVEGSVSQDASASYSSPKPHELLAGGTAAANESSACDHGDITSSNLADTVASLESTPGVLAALRPHTPTTTSRAASPSAAISTSTADGSTPLDGSCSVEGDQRGGSSTVTKVPSVCGPALLAGTEAGGKSCPTQPSGMPSSSLCGLRGTPRIEARTSEPDETQAGGKAKLEWSVGNPQIQSPHGRRPCTLSLNRDRWLADVYSPVRMPPGRGDCDGTTQTAAPNEGRVDDVRGKSTAIAPREGLRSVSLEDGVGSSPPLEGGVTDSLASCPSVHDDAAPAATRSCEAAELSDEITPLSERCSSRHASPSPTFEADDAVAEAFRAYVRRAAETKAANKQYKGQLRARLVAVAQASLRRYREAGGYIVQRPALAAVAASAPRRSSRRQRYQPVSYAELDVDRAVTATGWTTHARQVARGAGGKKVDVVVVALEGEAWLVVAPSLALQGLGLNEPGLYAARDFAADEAIGRYKGKILLSESSRAGLRRKIAEAVQLVRTRYMFECRHQRRWVLLDAAAGSPTPPLHLANDARGTGMTNNAAVSGRGIMRTLTTVKGFNLDGPLERNSHAELLWNYGDDYWSYWGAAEAAEPHSSGVSPLPVATPFPLKDALPSQVASTTRDPESKRELKPLDGFSMEAGREESVPSGDSHPEIHSGGSRVKVVEPHDRWEKGHASLDHEAACLDGARVTPQGGVAAGSLLLLGVPPHPSFRTLDDGGQDPLPCRCQTHLSDGVVIGCVQLTSNPDGYCDGCTSSKAADEACLTCSCINCAPRDGKRMASEEVSREGDVAQCSPLVDPFPACHDRDPDAALAARLAAEEEATLARVVDQEAADAALARSLVEEELATPAPADEYDTDAATMSSALEFLENLRWHRSHARSISARRRLRRRVRQAQHVVAAAAGDPALGRRDASPADALGQGAAEPLDATCVSAVEGCCVVCDGDADGGAGCDCHGRHVTLAPPPPPDQEIDLEPCECGGADGGCELLVAADEHGRYWCPDCGPHGCRCVCDGCLAPAAHCMRLPVRHEATADIIAVLADSDGMRGGAGDGDQEEPTPTSTDADAEGVTPSTTERVEPANDASAVGDADAPPTLRGRLRARGLDYGLAVRVRLSAARLPQGWLATADDVAVGVLADANTMADGEVIITIESRQGWLLRHGDGLARLRSVEAGLEHVEMLPPVGQASGAAEPSLGVSRSAVASHAPTLSLTSCVGSLGTACYAVAADAKGRHSPLSEELTLQQWLGGVTWWSEQLAAAAAQSGEVAVAAACGSVRTSVEAYTRCPTRHAPAVRDAAVNVLNVAVRAAMQFADECGDHSTAALREFMAVIAVLRLSSADEIVARLERECSQADEAASITRSVARLWSAARRSLHRDASQRSLVPAYVRLGRALSILPLAECLVALVQCTDALQELLSIDAADDERRHFHAPTPDCRGYIFNARQRGHALWLQRAFRHAVTSARLLPEAHPLVAGASTQPPRRLGRDEEAAGRRRLWAVYYDAMVPTSSRSAGRLPGWRPRMLRYVLMPWRGERPVTRCGGGAQLADEAAFGDVRRRMDRVLHVGAFFVKLYAMLEGHRPCIAVAGGASGGFNHGAQRLGAEHVAIDSTPQPEFVRAFGSERFVLGDATDTRVLDEVMGRVGVVGLAITLDCQLYSSVNLSRITTGAVDSEHQRQLPLVGELAARYAARGFEVIAENTKGASRALRDVFEHVACLQGSHFGLRTTRPRLIGTSTPMDTTILDLASQRALSRGVCNGMWRLMPPLDGYGRPVRRPCCRGNAVPIHGKAQPRLPIGLLNQAMGLPSGTMRWQGLTQALPPAYGALVTMHIVGSWLTRRHGLPAVTLAAVADGEGPIDVSIPHVALRTWAEGLGFGDKYGELYHSHFSSSADVPSYVAGASGMACTAHLDSLAVGDHKRLSLGDRSALTARPPTAKPSASVAALVAAPAKAAAVPDAYLSPKQSPVFRAGAVIAAAWRRYARRRHGRPWRCGSRGVAALAAMAHRAFAAETTPSSLPPSLSSLGQGDGGGTTCHHRSCGHGERMSEELLAMQRAMREQLRFAEGASVPHTAYDPSTYTHDSSTGERQAIMAAAIEKRIEKLVEGVCDDLSDVSVGGAMACHLGDVAVPAAQGGLQPLDDVLLDSGAFRGTIGLPRLQRYIDMAAPGAVLYKPHDKPVLLNAVTVGEGAVRVVGGALIDLYISGHRYTVDVPVLDRGDIFLLGNDFANARVTNIDYAAECATLRHCSDGACSTFTTPIVTRHAPVVARAVSEWSVAAIAAQETRSHFAYSEKSLRIPKWSKKAINLVLPRGVAKGAKLLVERVHGESPSRTQARVSEGYYVAGDGIVTVEVYNPSLSSSTYVSELEPLAQIFVAPDNLTGVGEADMTLEEIMDSITFGDHLSREEVDLFRPQLAARLHYFSAKRIGHIHGVKHYIPTPRIDSGEKAPPYVGPRKLSPEQYEAAREEFNKLVDLGILTPSTGGGYGSPIVMVKKPKGGWRMAVDFRQINLLTSADAHPLPNPTEALAAFGSATWFSALDASSAFHQIQLHEPDKVKTTVSFPWGAYYYESMPFGLAGASTTYQRMIDAVLSGLAWHSGTTSPHFVMAYVDDVIIYSCGSLQDHCDKLVQVLDRLGGSGMVLKPSKCFFAMREVEFLGHIVGADGTHMADKKLDAIRELLPDGVPLDATGAKRFVNMATYYGRFIDGFAHLAQAVHFAASHAGKDPSVLESLKVRAAVAAIKHAMTTGPILRRPDFSLPFRLEVDSAVHTGIGAVLTQEVDGFHHPVGYYSRSFIKEERRWSVTQAECCGVVEAVEYFRPLLLSNPHTTSVVTDHVSLQYLLTAKRLSDVLTRYAIRLSEYDIHILHRPGRTLTVPDAIGRLCVPRSSTTRTSIGDCKEDKHEVQGSWAALRSPRPVKRVCLVLLDDESRRVLVAGHSRSPSAELALPSVLLNDKETITRGVTRIYSHLKKLLDVRVDQLAPLDQLYVGATTYVFKRLQPAGWVLGSGVPYSMHTFEDLFMEREADDALRVVLSAWHVAWRAGEPVLPHAPLECDDHLDDDRTPTPPSPTTIVAALTRQRPQGHCRVAVAAYDDKQYTAWQREGAGARSLRWPERFADCAASESPREAALDILRDMGLADHHLDDATWSSRFASGTHHVIVRLAALPSTLGKGYVNLQLEEHGSAAASFSRTDDREVLRIIASLDDDHSPRQRDERFNALHHDDRPLAAGERVAEEHAEIAEAAAGEGGCCLLVRSQEMARRALVEIHEYCRSVSLDARIALDLEGVLNARGRIDLIQVAAGERVYVFDLLYTPAVLALVGPPSSWGGVASLASVLSDESVTKVVHSGYGDACALQMLWGIQLRNVFDTCMADVILFPKHARTYRGLGAVLHHWLDIELTHKGQLEFTPTLWLRRPLDSMALRYAADDVRHCSALYDRQLQGAIEWSLGECVKAASYTFSTTATRALKCVPVAATEEKLLVIKEAGDDCRLRLMSITVCADAEGSVTARALAEGARALWQREFACVPSKACPLGCYNLPKATRCGSFALISPFVNDDKMAALPSTSARAADAATWAVLTFDEALTLRDCFDTADQAALELCVLQYRRLEDPGLPRVLPPGDADGLAALTVNEGQVTDEEASTSASDKTLGCVLQQGDALALAAMSAAPTHAALVMHDGDHVLTMSTTDLDRLPGRPAATTPRPAFPRGRLHSGLPGHIVARQSLLNTLGPLERTSTSVASCVQQLRYIGRAGDTLYYAGLVGDLRTNAIALHSAWVQRTVTPSDAIAWSGFSLQPLAQLPAVLARADDLSAVGYVKRHAAPYAPHDSVPLAVGSARPLDAISYLGAMAMATAALTRRARADVSSVSQQGPSVPETPPDEVWSRADPTATLTPSSPVSEPLTLTATSSQQLQQRADAALRCYPGLHQSPPDQPPADDEPPLDDATMRVATTRVPGSAPLLDRAALATAQESDAYVRTLRLLAATTTIVERKEGRFSMNQGILYRLPASDDKVGKQRELVVVPASLRQEYLAAFHDRLGHVGAKRTLAVLRECVWWPQMRKDVRHYVRSCPTCAMVKLTRIPAGEARTMGNGEHPGDVWTFDITEIERKADVDKDGGECEELHDRPRKLLVFVDRFSRWVEAFPLTRDPTSQEVIDIFVDNIVRRHAYPRAVTCDRGSNLMQGEAPTFYEAMGIKLVASDSHMHQTQGLVERMNATLKDLLRSYVYDTGDDDWWRYLTYALLAYNTSDATATGYSPFYLLYGRDANLPLHLTMLPPPDDGEVEISSYVKGHVTAVHSAWESARRSMCEAAASVRRRQNRSRDVTFKLKVGDRVLVKKQEYGSLEVPYDGPFRIVEELGNDRYRLRDLHRVMHDEFHISRLKLYPFHDNDGNTAHDNDEYIIEDILAHRRAARLGEYEYLVKWRGWRKADATWVNENDMAAATLDIVAAYWRRTDDDKPTGISPTGKDFQLGSTTEPTPSTKAPAFRSHRDHHLIGASSHSTEVPAAAVNRVADYRKGKKKKKKKITAASSTTTTTPPSAACSDGLASSATTTAVAAEGVIATPPVTTVDGMAAGSAVARSMEGESNSRRTRRGTTAPTSYRD